MAYLLLLTLVLIAACFNVFYELGVSSVDNWDEARHGVNAYEMLKHHDYLVNTYLYQNDYYNLKPPISYLAVMLGYKLFGYNLLGLRIWSALAAIVTILLVAVFTKHLYGALASLIAAGTLATTCQYVLHHCARTGDADSLFVLFFTIALLALALMPKDIRWFYLSGLGFALAFLTKSWHAFPIVVVIGSYLWLSGRWAKLRLRDWGFFLASSGGPILIWGILRFSQDGWTFFRMMVQLDLLARSASPLEGHIGGPGYYLGVLKGNYGYWLLVLVVAWLLQFCGGKKLSRSGPSRLAIILWIVVPFVLFTIARTKLAWYVIPIYPAVAIWLGEYFSRLIHHLEGQRFLQALVCCGVLGCLLKNEGSILIRLRHVPTDFNQITLQQLSALPQHKGAKIFTMCGTYGGASQWDQAHLLCAELYGDLKAQNGGLEAFLKDDSRGSLLWLPRNVKEDRVLVDYSLKLVLEGKTSCLYCRNAD